MTKHLFLTGRKGVGKSTLIRGLLAAESAPLSGLFSPAHSGSLQSTDGSSISKQPIP